MFFWFIGTALASSWIVFGDPKFSYRPLVIGALAPDIVEIWFGDAGPMHSVVTSIALLALVMLTTLGRRPRRKFLLAGVIGLLMHLVYDGAFLNTRMFWWPLSGVRLSGAKIPSMERGLINLPLEVIGVLLILWWSRQRSGSAQSVH